MRKQQKAFTLIELMITVAVVAILAAIAYPSYQSQILRSHRSEAKAALLQAQVEQEKYFLQSNSYGTLAQIGAGKLGLKAGDLTAGGYYKIEFENLTGTTYRAKATAQGSQANDTGCTVLSIDETGSKLPTTEKCWTR